MMPRSRLGTSSTLSNTPSTYLGQATNRFPTRVIIVVDLDLGGLQVFHHVVLFGAELDTLLLLVGDLNNGTITSYSSDTKITTGQHQHDCLHTEEHRRQHSEPRAWQHALVSTIHRHLNTVTHCLHLEKHSKRNVSTYRNPNTQDKYVFI